MLYDINQNMSIGFIPEASEEYKSLNGSIKILADKKMG